MELSYEGFVNEEGSIQVLGSVNFFKGKNIVVTLETMSNTRSINQNKYYFGTVLPIVKLGLLNVGYKFSILQIHEFMKDKFLKKEVIDFEKGTIKTHTISSTELSTIGFNEYIEDIQQWASEKLEVFIPNPTNKKKDNEN